MSYHYNVICFYPEVKDQNIVHLHYPLLVKIILGVLELKDYVVFRVFGKTSVESLQKKEVNLVISVETF